MMLATLRGGDNRRLSEEPTGVADSGIPTPLEAMTLEPFRIVDGGADAKTRLFAAMRGPAFVASPARGIRQVPSAYLTDAAGPAGWSEAILGYVAGAASSDGSAA